MASVYLAAVARAASAADAPSAGSREDPGGALFILLVLFGLFATALYQLYRRLWQRIDQRISAAVDRIKAEVPPLLHVEEQVRREMGEFRKRLDQVEAINMNVQRQVERLRSRPVRRE